MLPVDLNSIAGYGSFSFIAFVILGYLLYSLIKPEKF